jgi:hypothetical protein
MTLRQWLCGLSGHDYLRRFERTHLGLRCTKCGHETTGWAIGRPETTPQPAPAACQQEQPA